MAARKKTSRKTAKKVVADIDIPRDDSLKLFKVSVNINKDIIVSAHGKSDIATKEGLQLIADVIGCDPSDVGVDIYYDVDEITATGRIKY